MQIEQLILYSHDGQKRRLKFNLNGVTIITGDSATGKSSLIEIVDYCLGAKECRVPDGVIRDSVSWYALKLKSSSGSDLFVARKGPDRDAKSTHKFVVRPWRTNGSPKFEELKETHNLADAIAAISEHLGMRPNETQFEDEQAKENYDITVRHAIKFCLQYQDEIASKRSLFHQQSESFVAQSIYDSLPYLLGFQSDDYLLKLEQLKQAKRTLTQAKRRLSEFEMSETGGFDVAVALLAEARDAGILAEAVEVRSPEALLAQLDTVRQWSPRNGSTISPNSGDELTRLQSQMTTLERQRQDLGVQLSAADSAMRFVSDVSTEMVEQHSRLSFASLIGSDDANEMICPLCQRRTTKTSAELPRLASVRQQFIELSEQLQQLDDHRPDLHDVVTTIQSQIGSIDARVAGLRASIRQLRERSREKTGEFDLSVRQALLVGRIQQYLEVMRPSLTEGNSLLRAVGDAEKAVARLETEISRGNVERQLRTVADRLQDPMTKWASALRLEFAGDPFRIDFKNLAVEVSRSGSSLPVPLYRMGSGKNWLGCHLIAHFALHQFFIENHRPVPRFLFLDQPTQVFYPPDEVDSAKGDVANVKLREADPSEDRDIVSRIFKWIFKQTSELNKTSGFQVIVTDHAELQTEQFQNALTDKPRWMPRTHGLIPSEWPMIP